MVSTHRLASQATLTPGDRLIQAAANGEVEQVKAELFSQVNPNVTLKSKEICHQIFTEVRERNLGANCTALVAAALKGRVMVVEVLLKDPRVLQAILKPKANVASILHLLASKSENDHIKIYEMLLKAGVTPLPTDARGDTPVASAVQYNNVPLLQVQLKHDTKKKNFEKIILMKELDPFMIPDIANIVAGYFQQFAANFTENGERFTPYWFALSKTISDPNPDPASPSRRMVKMLHAHHGDAEISLADGKTIRKDMEEVGAPADVINLLEEKLPSPPRPADDALDVDSDNEMDGDDRKAAS